MSVLIKVIKSQWIVYVEDTKSYMRIDQVPENMKVLKNYLKMKK